MRKRLLGILLALSLCVSLLPTAVLAEDGEVLDFTGTRKPVAGLVIDGAADKSWTVKNTVYDVTVSGTAVYAAESNTLTLTNVNMDSDNDNFVGITYSGSGELTIVLNGSNSLNCGQGIQVTNREDSKSLTIQGSGTLTVQAQAQASSNPKRLSGVDTLTVSGGATVTAIGGNSTLANLTVSGTGSKFTVGDESGCYTTAVTISNAPEVTDGGTIFVDVCGSLSLPGSAVTGTTPLQGIVNNGTVKISGVVSDVKVLGLTGTGLVTVAGSGGSGGETYTNTGLKYIDTALELSEESDNGSSDAGINSANALADVDSGYYWWRVAGTPESKEEGTQGTEDKYFLVIKNYAFKSIAIPRNTTIKIIGAAYVGTIRCEQGSKGALVTIQSNSNEEAELTVGTIAAQYCDLTLGGIAATIGSVDHAADTGKMTIQNAAVVRIGCFKWVNDGDNCTAKNSGLVMGGGSQLTVTDQLSSGSMLWAANIVMDDDKSIIELENCALTNYGAYWSAALAINLVNFLPDGYEVRKVGESSDSYYTICQTNDTTNTPVRNITLKRHYTVKVKDAAADGAITGGEVTVSLARAPKDATITVTATPDTTDNYVVDYVEATYTADADGTSSKVTVAPQGTGNVYTFTMPAADVTVTAAFKKDGYSVTVKTCEHGSVTANPDKWNAGQAQDGGTVTLTVTPDAGYELYSLTAQEAKGTELTSTTVTVTKDATDSNKHTFTMPRNDVRVEATFKTIEYTISYNLDGGAWNNSVNLKNKYTVADEAYTLPNGVTKAGHAFGGWYENQECNGDAVTQIAKGSTGNKTFYAKWTPETYTVTYASGTNGTGTVAAGTKTYGVNFTLSSNTFTRTGYTQTGWATTDGGEKAYDLGGAYDSNADVTLYPVWKANEYKVTLNTNGGTINSGNVTGYTYGVGATLPTDVTKAGHAFGGWYENQECNGDAVTQIAKGSTGNKTFYAKWNGSTKEEDPIYAAYRVEHYRRDSSTGTYTLYEGGMPTTPGAGAADEEKAAYTSELKALLKFGEVGQTAAATANNYEGYLYNETASTSTASGTVIKFEEPASMLVLKLYYEKEYTVTFDANDGTVTPTTAKTGVDYKLASLPIPTRDGYTFNGWFTESTDGTEVTTNTTFSANTTIYAQWTAKPAYTIAVVNNDEQGTVGVSAAGPTVMQAWENATVTLTLTPKTGYEMDNLAVSYDNAATTYCTLTQGTNGKWTFTMPADDVTVTVTWKTSAPAPKPSTPSTPVYPIIVEESTDGEAESSLDYAHPGTIITITTTPEGGKLLSRLAAVDESGNKLTLTRRNGNQFTFIMPASKVTVTARFRGEQPFTDVKPEHYFFSAVNWALDNGITGGVTATRFEPYAACTRGQMVTFLWRALGEPAAKTTVNPFSDVKEGSAFYRAILWAAENGIVTGYADGTFRPNAPVTRQQAAAILHRYARFAGMDVRVGEDTNILSYHDALDVSEYAIAGVQWAVGAGVMQGSEGYLYPYHTCTRAQIVTMLYRLLG